MTDGNKKAWTKETVHGEEDEAPTTERDAPLELTPADIGEQVSAEQVNATLEKAKAREIELKERNAKLSKLLVDANELVKRNGLKELTVRLDVSPRMAWLLVSLVSISAGAVLL